MQQSSSNNNNRDGSQRNPARRQQQTHTNTLQNKHNVTTTLEHWDPAFAKVLTHLWGLFV